MFWLALFWQAAGSDNTLQLRVAKSHAGSKLGESTDLQIGVRISFDSGQDRGSLIGASHERGYVQNGNVGSDEPGQNLSANFSARGSATPWHVGPAAFGEQVPKRKFGARFKVAASDRL